MEEKNVPQFDSQLMSTRCQSSMARYHPTCSMSISNQVNAVYEVVQPSTSASHGS
jgi:hypothetical protein